MIRHNLIFISGLSGASLFILTAILAGFQFDNYSHISQYISEAYAYGTPYGPYVRWFGYIPSGILITVFAILASREFRRGSAGTVGFIALGIFYGIGTVIVSLFPCDPGCNKELIDPSLSQLIHSIASVFTYIFTPVSLLLIGTGFKNERNDFSKFRKYAILSGALSAIFVTLFLVFPTGEYAGLNQRIIEVLILGFIILYSFRSRSE
jgi:cytochrome bd-type quinol oxidase subunit 2